MNIDLFSAIEFGDAPGLRAFILAHDLIHSQTVGALFSKFGVNQSTFGLKSGAAEQAWIDRMSNEDATLSAPLTDWIELHAQIHTQTYALLGAGQAPDLSLVDFGDPKQFYDWMSAHQQIHDFEQQQLGLS